MKSSVCVECGNEAGGRYCPHCGVRLNVEALGIASVVEAAAEVNSRIFRTTRDLLARPGLVARAWIAGHRKRYANPIRFCIASGILVAVGAQLAPLTIEGISESDRQMLTYVLEYLSFIALVITVPLALIMSIVTRSAAPGRGWLDWYVVGAYAYGITGPIQYLIAIAGLPAGGLLPLVWFVLLARGLVDDRKTAIVWLTIAGHLIWFVVLALVIQGATWIWGAIA